LVDILKRIIKKTEVTKSVNKNNTDHGILFEAVNLIIHYGNDLSENLQNDVVKLLGIFISVREPNLKYLGLETMCKLCAAQETNIE
jgi:AP-2 complex subunit alpha